MAQQLNQDGITAGDKNTQARIDAKHIFPVQESQHDQTVHQDANVYMNKDLKTLGADTQQDNITTGTTLLNHTNEDDFAYTDTENILDDVAKDTQHVQYNMPVPTAANTVVDEKVQELKNLQHTFNKQYVVEDTDGNNVIDQNKTLFKKVPVDQDMLDQHGYRIREKSAFEFIAYFREMLLSMSEYKRDKMLSQLPGIEQYLISQFKKRLDHLKSATKFVIRKPQTVEDMKFLYQSTDPKSEFYIDEWSIDIMNALLGLQQSTRIHRDDTADGENRRPFYQRGFLSSGLLWLSSNTKERGWNQDQNIVNVEGQNVL